MLPWHQPDPRSKLPAILKMGRIIDGSHERRGRQRSNAGDRPEALAHGMRCTNSRNFLGVIREALFQGAKLVIELPKELGA
jgi:hypothetical protein